MNTIEKVNTYVATTTPTLQAAAAKVDFKTVIDHALPILIFLSTAFFVPKTWRNYIAILITVLTALPTNLTDLINNANK